MLSYMQGRFYWNKRYGESLKLAESSFQKAIQADPATLLLTPGWRILILCWLSPELYQQTK